MPPVEDKGALQGKADHFVAAMVEAKGLLDQIQAEFCNKLWPAISTALKRGAAQVAELECKNGELRAQIEGERALKTSKKAGNQAPLNRVPEAPRSCDLLLPVQSRKLMSSPLETPIRGKPGHMKGKSIPLADVTNKQGAISVEPGWRSTHDSFLDTPREEVMAKLSSTLHPQQQSEYAAEELSTEISTPVTAKVCSNGFVSTRGPLQAIGKLKYNIGSSKKSNAPSFKFNEVIRNKRDRDSLVATECLQCKAFYDAVGTRDASGGQQARCDHLKVSSRHRYQNLPPNTPEGFWNIGFDDTE